MSHPLPSASATDSAPFRVLMICTANHCRSPLAERLLRLRFPAPLAGAPWEITSAGVDALVGRAMHANAAEVLLDRGAPVDSFVGRQITPELLTAQDLILTATVAHRSAVVSLAPATLNRTFTLLQFARLVSAAPPEPVADGREWGLALRSAAIAGRSLVQPGMDDDLADPIGYPIAAYERCADEIEQAIAVLIPRP